MPEATRRGRKSAAASKKAATSTKSKAEDTTEDVQDTAEEQTGRAEANDIADVLFQKFLLFAWLHVILAGLITAAVVVLGVSCWHMLRGRNVDLFRSAAKAAFSSQWRCAIRMPLACSIIGRVCMARRRCVTSRARDS